MSLNFWQLILIIWKKLKFAIEGELYPNIQNLVSETINVSHLLQKVRVSQIMFTLVTFYLFSFGPPLPLMYK